MLGGLALAIYLAVGAEPATLMFDREAISEGELWRLLTGHLSHVDSSHLLLNVAGFLFLGILFERKASQALLLFVLSATAIDTWLWVLRPDVILYCGLSGIVWAVLAVGLLHAWWAGDRQPWVGAVAAAMLGKLSLELRGAGTVIDHADWPGLAGAHIVGLGAGLMFGVIEKRMRS